ncbi:MAG: transposase, partial [Chloroflexota bacterium]|nr:transposase [Chloroflexota bacterium]
MRLKEFDYSSPGAYFVTVVSYKRANIFGTIKNNVVQLNQIGIIVEKAWLEIPMHYPFVKTDAFVIMPNHFHGILIIHDDVGARHASPLRRQKQQPLGVIVGSFKSAATKRI